MHLRENVSLARYTTLSIGGPARWFAEIETESDILEALAFAHTRTLPIQILGGGSNVLIADAGFNGLVLHIGLRGIREHNSTLEVAAGEEWDPIVAYAVEHNLAGIECLSGIPGRTGGTPVQNVGAYGQEVSETIASVQVLDLKDTQVRELCPEACEFSYRASIFNTTERGRFIVLRVTYALTPGGSPRITYADLKHHFEGRETPPSLAETREAVRHIRALKGMLIVPGDADCRSAGSFFKNPMLSQEQHEDLKQRAAARGFTVPNYPALETRKKVSAAWLVERSGFAKGFGFGRVGISTKHALAIVNRGGATAADVLAL